MKDSNDSVPKKMNREEIRIMKAQIISRANCVVKKLLSQNFSGMELFFKFKFERIGLNPLTSNSNPYHLLEQINQTFTILMSLYAAEKIFTAADNFEFALGTQAGRDIRAYSDNKCNAEAEIFATINPNNNKKLHTDITRIANSVVSGILLYVIYLAPQEHHFRIDLPKEVNIIHCPLNEFKEWWEESAK